MTLQDTVRQETQAVRDSLGLLERKCANLRGEKEAAEERRKRAATEITTHRTLEGERGRLVTEAREKVAEVQQKLEEIERQRSELIDRLMERQAEVEKVKGLFDQANKATQNAQSAVKEARDAIGLAEKALEDSQKEKARFEEQLKHALVQALDVHLIELAKRIEKAFEDHEARRKHLAAVESFKKARHENRRIGDLCDQRDQFVQILGKMATVPGVKDTIRSALQNVEREIEKLYPGALAAESVQPDAGLIEDLHYFTSRDGKATMILPIPESASKAIQAGGSNPEANRAVHILWNLIQGAELKPTDGEFRYEGKRCIFASNLDPDILALLENFRVPMPVTGTLEFRFVALPGEIQEALLS